MFGQLTVPPEVAEGGAEACKSELLVLSFGSGIRGRCRCANRHRPVLEDYPRAASSMIFGRRPSLAYSGRCFERSGVD